MDLEIVNFITQLIGKGRRFFLRDQVPEQRRQRLKHVGFSGTVPTDHHGHPMVFVKVDRHILEVFVFPYPESIKTHLGPPESF